MAKKPNTRNDVSNEPKANNATESVAEVSKVAKSAFNGLIGKIVAINHANGTAEVVVDKANLQSKIQLFGDDLEVLEVASENLKKIEDIASRYPNNFEFYCEE